MRTTTAVASATAVVAGYAVLHHLGRTSGSTDAERHARLPGDALVSDPGVVTDHAVTIDAPPEAVWPWLAQMGWGRGGWYTARCSVGASVVLPSATNCRPVASDIRARPVASSSSPPAGAPCVRTT